MTDCVLAATTGGALAENRVGMTYPGALLHSR